MKDDEELEQGSIAEAPSFIAATLVDAIHHDHGDGIDGSDSDGDAHVEKLGIEIIGNVEGLLPSELGDMRGGDCLWQFGRRELEEGGRWESDANGGLAELSGQVEVVHDVRQTRSRNDGGDGIVAIG